MSFVFFVSYRRPVRLIKREKIEAWKMRSKLKKMRKESFEKLFILETALPEESAAHLQTDQNLHGQ